MINILILVSGVLLVVSKFFDCLTTTRGINKRGINGEKNMIARNLMQKFGAKQTIWGIFAFTLILSITLVFESIRSESLLYQSGFVSLAIFISIIQFYVAYLNYINIYKNKAISKFAKKITGFIPGVKQQCEER